MKKRGILIVWLNRFLLLATLLVGGGAMMPSNVLKGSSLLSLAFPFFFPVFILMLFPTLRFAPKRILPVLLGIGLTCIPALAQIPFAKNDPPESPFVTVASYNVRAFYQVGDASKKMAQWAEDNAIDVLCMQEVRRPGYYPVDQGFSALSFAPKWSGYAVGIFSKYPIVYQEPLLFSYIDEDEEYPKGSAGLADIALPWDTVRFINVHLNSTGVRDGDMSIEANTDAILSRGKDIAKKLAGSDYVRGLQSKSIIDWIEQSPHPVVLCGDFNSVPGGNLYFRLLQQMEDPYLFKGSGSMGSFEPLKRRYLPIKIDWTLHTKDLQSFDQHIDHVHLSDHYPLVTTIGPPALD